MSLTSTGSKRTSTVYFKLPLTEMEVGFLRRVLIRQCIPYHGHHGLQGVLDKLKEVDTPMYTRLHSAWQEQEAEEKYGLED